MIKAVIGITVERRYLAAASNERQLAIVGCPVDYGDAVERSGGAPLMLPRSANPEVIAAAMSRVDALLLSGGGDVVSTAYGAEPAHRSVRQDRVRDRMECEAVRAAIEAGMPILAICRGIQILNVALGGTLIQDIPRDVTSAGLHASDEGQYLPVHTIALEPESRLSAVLGAPRLEVNSAHHQAVKDVAPGLRVSARAADGVIEGLESDDGRAILAVQFHPETCAREYPRFQKLFDWLVAEAAARAA